MLKIWKRLSSEIVFKNKYWTYFIDKFTIDSSKVFEYHYVQTLGSTLVIPVTEFGKIVLINQYRYLNQKFSLEFPCGSIEYGLTKYENALKELKEETGFSSSEISEFGFFNPYNGVTNEICYTFLAKQLFPIESIPDETEQIEVHCFTEDEIDSMISSNEIWDGMTIAAWTQFKAYKKKMET